VLDVADVFGSGADDGIHDGRVIGHRLTCETRPGFKQAADGFHKVLHSSFSAGGQAADARTGKSVEFEGFANCGEFTAIQSRVVQAPPSPLITETPRRRSPDGAGSQL